jgi:hypothetical protein
MTDTNTQEAQLSPFLEHQKRVLESRAQQDRDIAERQKYSLTPAAQESSPTQSAYAVETFDATNNRTERRIIQPLPTPQRIQPAKPLTKSELNDMIAELRDEMATQQERFDHKDEIDKANTDKRQELYNTISELTQRLNAAKGELDQLNRAGSVRDGFIAFAARAEQRITSIATGVYGYLLEKFSQDRHEAPFGELTALLKEEIRFKVDRSGVRGLTQPSFARLHEAPKESITNARIEATLEKVYTATEKLEGALEK